MKRRAAAAVLCGGRGERLKPLTDYYQKTMIPLGPRKRPLLEYVVYLLAHHNVKDITLLTGYRSSEIERYFGDGSRFDVNIRYSVDRRESMGSLNAVVGAARGGEIQAFDDLVIYYGDIFSEFDISKLLETHRKAGADATVVLEKGFTLPVGVARVKGGWLSGFEEKPRVEMNVATGCLVVGRRGLGVMRRVASAERGDIMADFVPVAIKRGLKIAPYFTKEFWRDVGTVTSYQQLNDEINEDKLSFMPAAPPRIRTEGALARWRESR